MRRHTIMWPPTRRRSLAGFMFATIAFLAACQGGGSSDASGDGTLSGPTLSQTIEVSGSVAASSPLAPANASAVPPANAGVALTRQQLMEVAGRVRELIAAALGESPVSDEALTSRHLAPSYADMKSISSSIEVCSETAIGQPFLDYDTGRTVTTRDTDYSLMLLNNCSLPAMASKVLFDITGNPRFRDANATWQPLHSQVVREIGKIDPRAGGDYWQSLLAREYLH